VISVGIREDVCVRMMIVIEMLRQLTRCHGVQVPEPV